LGSMRIQTSQQKYLNETFPLVDPELEEIRHELHRHNVEFMSISGHEARILQFLIRGFGVRKVVEVGTLFGYSALAMAKSLPEDGQLWTLEKNQVNFELADKMLKASKSGAKVRALCGDAIESLAGLENDGPFDLVFIDADKAAYTRYLDWAERNVRKGGLIVGDNTFLFGALWGESRDHEVSERAIQVMKEFNSRLADTSRYNSVLIPTFEGMTVAQKLF
jgi:predicted O-methyltransferase YrrM